MEDLIEWLRFVEELEAPLHVNKRAPVGSGAVPMPPVGPRSVEKRLQRADTDMEFLQEAFEKLSYLVSVNCGESPLEIPCNKADNYTNTDCQQQHTHSSTSSILRLSPTLRTLTT